MMAVIYLNPFINNFSNLIREVRADWKPCSSSMLIGEQVPRKKLMQLKAAE
jgi:hypothetical protein